jgi:hypothetical protein
MQCHRHCHDGVHFIHQFLMTLQTASGRALSQAWSYSRPRYDLINFAVYSLGIIIMQRSRQLSRRYVTIGN